MKIEFTKEQFSDLLKIVYLGQWMANAIHNGSKDDPVDEKLDAIEDYIFSFAGEFGLDGCVEYDKKFKRHFPTNKFDKLVRKYIDDYDEQCFWEELFYQLSNRDFERAYSKDEISKMRIEEIFGKEEPFREKWNKEIIEHGIDRLEISIDGDNK